MIIIWIPLNGSLIRFLQKYKPNSKRHLGRPRKVGVEQQQPNPVKMDRQLCQILGSTEEDLLHFQYSCLLLLIT